MLAIFCVTNLTRCSTKGSSTSSGKDAPGGRVEVSGTTTDDDPTEFKQADESVQIGGVNLTGNQNLGSQYIIKAYLVYSGGIKQIYSGLSSTSNFKFTIQRASSYIRVDVTNLSGMTKSAILAPSFSTSTVRANVAVSRITDVAARLLSIAHDKAMSGDANAVNIFNNYLVSVADLVMVAGSAIRVVEQQKAVGATAAPIDLTNLTQSLMTATAAKFNSLSGEYTPLQYAQKVSKASYESIYAIEQAAVPPEVLAYRTNSDLGTSPAATSDVAYTAIVTSADRVLDAAYRVEATVYRTASTPSDASSASTASTVKSTFEAFYQTCVTVETCVDSTFTPPPPPPTGDYTGSSGSTTGGSTTGGSTTGGSTTGGSTTGGGCSALAIQIVSTISATVVNVAFSGGTSANYTVYAYTDASCSSPTANSSAGASSPRIVTVPATGIYYFKVIGASESSPCFGPRDTTSLTPQ